MVGLVTARTLRLTIEYKLEIILKLRPYGQAVKTPPFHGGIPSSNLGRVTITTYHHLQSKWIEGQMSRCFKVACNFVNKPAVSM